MKICILPNPLKIRKCHATICFWKNIDSRSWGWRRILEARHPENKVLVLSTPFLYIFDGLKCVKALFFWELNIYHVFEVSLLPIRLAQENAYKIKSAEHERRETIKTICFHFLKTSFACWLSCLKNAAKQIISDNNSITTYYSSLLHGVRSETKRAVDNGSKIKKEIFFPILGRIYETWLASLFLPDCFFFRFLFRCSNCCCNFSNEITRMRLRCGL